MAQAVTIPANDLKRPFELHAADYEKKALEVLRSGWVHPWQGGIRL